jgi:dihydroflavonol-4-reductase
MTNPDAKGQRFLATSDVSTSLPKIAKILHSQANEFAKNVTTKVLPDWLVKILSLFKPELKQVASQLGKVKILSNEKAKRVLNWQPRGTETIVIETANSLVKFGIVK